MVEKKYHIVGLHCLSCVWKIESALSAKPEIKKVRVDLNRGQLTVASATELSLSDLQQSLTALGNYRLSDDSERKGNASVWWWGTGSFIFILLAFYLVQVIGMSSWTLPLEFMTNFWYFTLPLAVGFATQVFIWRSLHQLSLRRGSGVVAASGGISGGAMLACCLHNFIPLLAVIGLSGLATFFSLYQTETFIFSLAVTYGGVAYMLSRYISANRHVDKNCHS
ncbi:MAG: cation transporter [Candidatus Komeilibacteria bacterium]|nr:cation transporter [Candidatus Komeilibacteria bacterium]